MSSPTEKHPSPWPTIVALGPRRTGGGANRRPDRRQWRERALRERSCVGSRQFRDGFQDEEDDGDVEQQHVGVGDAVAAVEQHPPAGLAAALRGRLGGRRRPLLVAPLAHQAVAHPGEVRPAELERSPRRLHRPRQAFGVRELAVDARGVDFAGDRHPGGLQHQGDVRARARRRQAAPGRDRSREGQARDRREAALRGERRSSQTVRIITLQQYLRDAGRLKALVLDFASVSVPFQYGTRRSFP